VNLESYLLAECELHDATRKGGTVEGDGTDEREAELQAALVEAEAPRGQRAPRLRRRPHRRPVR
jgi:hypothetical protein